MPIFKVDYKKKMKRKSPTMLYHHISEDNLVFYLSITWRLIQHQVLDSIGYVYLNHIYILNSKSKFTNARL